MRTPEGSRRSSPKGAIAFWDCEVSSTNNLTQPLGAVDKLENAEYLLQRAIKRTYLNVGSFVFLGSIINVFGGNQVEPTKKKEQGVALQKTLITSQRPKDF